MEDKKKIRILAELADDSLSRSLGLMFRKYLGKNSGMLFVFDKEDFYPFWMKNTYVPLDIAFIKNGGKIIDIRTMMPLSTRRIMASEPALYALEMNAGWFKESGLKVGHTLGEREIVTSQTAGQPEVMLTHDFKTAVINALKNHWNLLIQYVFKPVVYRRGIKVQRDGEKPPMNDYHLILDGSVTLDNGKSFEYNDAGNGEFIVVPCLHSSGAPRCFFIDGVVDFRYFWNGKTFVDPREIQEIKRKKKRIKFDKNPALEGIKPILFEGIKSMPF